ncbi:hypothetical protein ACP8HZ_04795 [Francisella noatunensis]
MVTLIGTGTDVFVSFYKRYSKSLGIKPAQVIVCEDMEPLEILEKINLTQPANTYMLVGVGNIKDIGMSLVDYCDQSHKQKHGL